MVEEEPVASFRPEIFRALQDSGTTLVGWGAGSVFRELQRLYPLPLAYLIDSSPEHLASQVQGLDVFPPAHLELADTGGLPSEKLIVIYTGSHDAVSHQIARIGEIPSIPAQHLLAYPPLPSHVENAGDHAATCLRSIEQAVIWQILGLRAGDRFAVHGAGLLGRIVVELCLARDRKPCAVLDDALAGGSVRGVPIKTVEAGIADGDLGSVIFAPLSQRDALAGERERVRRLLAAADARRRREAFARWDVSCRKLAKSGLSGHAFHVKWTEEREQLWRSAGPVPCRQADQSRLASLKDRYRGKRIFVIGNGPSLNKQDLSKLEGEYTFALNKLYLLYDRVNWRPSFYTAMDWRVTPDMVEEINQLEGSTLFVPERFRGMIRGGDAVYHYHCKNSLPRGWKPVEERFAFDATQGVWLGASSSIVAIQLAFYMGFDPIILIGNDLDYKIPPSVRKDGLGHYGVTHSVNFESTADDDTAHFDPRYFGAGSRWHEPQLQVMRSAFRNCLDAAESRGRVIQNATAGGKLEVFERVDFDSLFGRRAPRRPQAGPVPPLSQQSI